MNPGFHKKLYTPFTVSAAIALLCLLMLAINQKLYKFPHTPLRHQALYAAEIDGLLNYTAQQGDECCFSVREQPEGFYRAILTPLANNPGFGFYLHANINDFIHKPADSDTIIMIKNNTSYYYSIGK